MIQLPYDLATARLNALSECLAATNMVLAPGEGEDWKPSDAPNRDKAVAVQSRLLDAITSLLVDAAPTPPAGRRTS